MNDPDSPDPVADYYNRDPNALELTRLGHAVELVDVSEETLWIARNKAEQANLPIGRFHLGSATDLWGIRFDARSCFRPCQGPLPCR